MKAFAGRLSNSPGDARDCARQEVGGQPNSFRRVDSDLGRGCSHTLVRQWRLRDYSTWILLARTFLKTLSPDGVTDPRSPLFHVKMWKEVENAEKCGKCERMWGNVGKMCKMWDNVEKVEKVRKKWEMWKKSGLRGLVTPCGLEGRQSEVPP